MPARSAQYLPPMKKISLIIFAFAAAFLASCDGRTGYLDAGQESIIAMLTDPEWVMTYAEYGSTGSEAFFDGDTQVYRFGRDRKGWCAAGSATNPSVKDYAQYFQWGFTTDNFSVIRLARSGGGTDYMLIEKLTPTELWVQSVSQDPVLHPAQYSDFYKFKARKPADR